jgi:hypothetical protein
MISIILISNNILGEHAACRDAGIGSGVVEFDE